MLTGSLLTRILPDADGFELGLPECRTTSNLSSEPQAISGAVFQFTTTGGDFRTIWHSTFGQG
jgi:hypothetical protein